MNHITKRYNIANSIINNGGIKTMLNKIRAYIWYYSKSIYSSIYNKVGKFLNRYNPRAITNMITYLIDDVKALEICVNMAKSEHESLKNVHNNLALDVSDFKTRLLKLEDFELRTLKEKAERVLSDKEYIKENDARDLEYEKSLDNDEKNNVMELGNKLIPSKYLKLSQTLINDDKVNKCVDEIAKVVYFDYNINDKQAIKDVILKHINLTK